MPNVSKNSAEAGPSEPNPTDMAAAVKRARWLLLISALTTAVAVAAVLGVIGYRIYFANETIAGRITTGTVFLPQGAHVDSTTISDGRIVVTFDVAGISAVRIFDLNTLQQVGQLSFATAH